MDGNNSHKKANVFEKHKIKTIFVLILGLIVIVFAGTEILLEKLWGWEALSSMISWAISGKPGTEERNGWAVFIFTAAAYNLVRIRNLTAAVSP